MEHTFVVVKKTYQPPLTKIGMIAGGEPLLAASSGGVYSGAPLGDEYHEGDVTYSRGGSGFWDDKE